jgi:hypothetical protein
MIYIQSKNISVRVSINLFALRIIFKVFLNKKFIDVQVIIENIILQIIPEKNRHKKSKSNKK